jgi:ADP-ribose pyrophosphatase
MIQPWTLLERTEAYRNRWLHATLDRVRLPDGQVYEYTTIHRAQVGVGAVVLNDQGQLLLEQEYRHPVEQVLYQIPGGLAERDEEPVACIRRELQEETGLIGQEFRFLGTVWNNPASSNGAAQLYLCRDARAGGQLRHDHSEFISWDWHDLAWVKDRVRDGTIQDRVVVAALAFLWLHGEIAP